jgi:hypothetical protein
LAIKTLRDMPRRKTRKGKQQQPTIKIESSQSDEGTKHDPTYNLEVQELSESYMEKTYNLSKVVKEEIIEETSSKEHKYERKCKKPKRSIDLNRPASEENQGEDREETEDGPKKIED